MTIRPVRLQLSRRKGFDLQALSQKTNGLAAAKVDRSTTFGNPYQAGHDGDGDRAWLVKLFREFCTRDAIGVEFSARARAELRGKNLACWCPLDGKPCHADALLELANK